MTDIRQLQAFVAVAEELHFGRAASRLGYSPSNISQQIRDLERRLKLELFSRTSRRVELTDVGERLVMTARSVLGALDQFDDRAAELRLEPPRRLTVAYGPLTGHILTELVGELRDGYEGAQIETRNAATSVEVSQLVASGRADVGITQWVCEGMERISLDPPVDYAFLVPEGHRLYDRQWISFTDLDGEPMMCPPRDQNEQFYDEVIMKFWADLGAQPDFRPQSVTSVDHTYDFAAAGQGVSYTLPVRPAPSGTRFVPVRGPRPPHLLFVIWAPGSRAPLLPEVLTTAVSLFGTDTEAADPPLPSASALFRSS